MPSSEPNLRTNDWHEWPFVLALAALIGASIYGICVSGPLIDAILGISHP